MSKLFLTCLLLIVPTYSLYIEDLKDRSLTFVVDITGSMHSEINEVIKIIDDIFDMAMRTEDSQIKNIALVTFGDPDAELRTVTNNLNELKNALAQINVYGGADCPEYALTGIDIALRNSLPYSTVFVFTDASAADYMRFEEIKSLAVEKNIRIFFILTGSCGNTSSKSYQVYHNLATATHGNVFEVLKENIKDVIPNLMLSIRSKRHILVPTTVPQVNNDKFYFTVDDEPVSLMIIIRGREPRVVVTDPEGKTLEYDEISQSEQVLSIKIRATKPGIYRAVVTATSKIDMQIFGTTTVHFVK